MPSLIQLRQRLVVVFWVREGLPRPNAFISSWMAWFAHILMLEVYFDLV